MAGQRISAGESKTHPELSWLWRGLSVWITACETARWAEAHGRGAVVRGWTSTTVRACLATTLSGAIMASTAGCSPELRPLAGVYVDQQGTAHALLRSCDDDGRVRGPWLRGTVAHMTNGSASDETQDTASEVSEASEAEEPWIGWDARGLHQAADFPLFAPPAQWAAEIRGPQTLQPGYSYELSFADPDDSYVYNGSVTFDARQLAGVPTGRVLTLEGTMTRQAFEDLARKAC